MFHLLSSYLFYFSNSTPLLFIFLQGIEAKFGARYDVNVIMRDPWILTFENFLTDAEVDALISTNQKWERSTDTGSTNEFGETGLWVVSARAELPLY